jgi:hypothetical protein
MRQAPASETGDKTKANRQNTVDKRERGVVSAGQIVKLVDYNENLGPGRAGCMLTSAFDAELSNKSSR